MIDDGHLCHHVEVGSTIVFVACPASFPPFGCQPGAWGGGGEGLCAVGRCVSFYVADGPWGSHRVLVWCCVYTVTSFVHILFADGCAFPWYGPACVALCTACVVHKYSCDARLGV